MSECLNNTRPCTFAVTNRGRTFRIGLACWVIMAFASSIASAQSQLSVASPFTDNAVLQRGEPVPVWGNAKPGTTVTVRFAGQEQTTEVDAEGFWKVQLEALASNARPQVLKISNGDAQISFANVLVGEVWICAGQSNMAMEVNKVPGVAALLPSPSNIRCFEVKRTVAMTEQDRLTGEWVEQHPSSAVAFAFAHALEEAGDIPVGIILACWGSSSIEAWMPRDMTETVPHFQTIMEEFDADTATRDRIASIIEPKRWSNKDDIFLRRQPNILYNAMMHPLAPFACRGVVWYQGERNTQSMRGMVKTPWFSRNSGMLKYGETLKAWIQRYRKEWGNDEMHFMIVMLPGYHKLLPTGPKMSREQGAVDPSVHSWAWMRESQMSALDLERTSVVNTIDLGDLTNIHPKDKLPIGRRLALLAAHETMGQEVEAFGPMLDNVETRGAQMIVNFRHATGLKTVDGKTPRGFWVADDSARWVRANAEVQGQRVILNSELANPLYVRYAFVGKPDVNLVNGDDLPAYPFRTDDFEP